MPQVFFYLFSVLAIAGACAMVIYKNPVSSALSMVAAFLGLAALFVGLNAYFVGIIQILVYAGAIMVLFIFIIMLLDLKSEEKRKWKPATIAASIVIPIIFLCQLLGVVMKLEAPGHQELDLEAAAAEHSGKISENLTDNQLPDVHLIGRTIFAGNHEAGTTSNNLPLQIMGVLLLVATIGVVVLSKKSNSVSK